MLIYSRLEKTYCILKEIVEQTLLPKEIIVTQLRYHSTNSGEYDLKKNT